MTLSPSGDNALPLSAVLATDQLGQRPARPPDYQVENQALAELAQALANSPSTIMARLADVAMRACRAGSAGISLLTSRDGADTFDWAAIVGTWAAQIGGGTPRDFSPCGTVLDLTAGQLFIRPERHFAYLAPITPAINEALLVPFFAQGQAVGTAWVVAHDDRHFDAEDLRLLSSLSKFAAGAFQVLQSLDALAGDRAAKTVEASAKFRTFFDQGSYFAGLMSLDGTILEANRLCVEGCGFTREEVIGKKFWECGWWNRSPALIAMIQEATRTAAGGELFRRESNYFLADGSQGIVDLILTPVKDEQGKVLFIAPTGTDITERKQSERASIRLAAIVESSDDAIISKDLSSIVTSWNAGATRLFGYTADEMIGRSITVLIPPDRINEEPGILERICRGERIEHYETVRRRKDGSLIDISLSISPLIDHQGQIVGASKIARDITDRKRAEQALLEADRQKNEFLATLAHELRNPLAPLRNSLNILRLAGDGPPAFERIQETMERQIDHMVRLVDDLLEISRITTGKIELRLEPVEIASVIRSAVETSRPLIDAGGHQLATKLPAEPLTVNADPVRLSQVIANLLNNAAKYTDPGGQIWITVSRAADELLVSVRDNGVGISADLLPHVLEMFTQADRSKRQEYDGLGIGLALAKRLVEMHGGSLQATSEGEGQGSEFIVRLPLAARQLPATRERPPTRRHQPKSAGQKILVVDDNQDAANSLAKLLSILGNDVRVTHDGQSALQTYADFRPTMVLLDLGMPGMNGYEVAERLREQPGFQNVTLVALTGWGQADDRRRTEEAGFDHHLVKPVQLDTLQLLLAGVERR